MKTNIIEEFREKYADYLGCAYEKIPDRNLGDEMVSDILKALSRQREEFEILLAEVIDDLYLKYKEGFCDYENKTHKLGWFKEQIKSEIYKRLKH